MSLMAYPRERHTLFDQKRPYKKQENELIKMINKLKQFLTEERGQDMVEYSLLLVLIGTIVLIYLTGMGMNLSNLLQQIGDRLDFISRSMS